MGWREMTDVDVDELVAQGRIDELVDDDESDEESEEHVDLDQVEYDLYRLLVYTSTQWHLSQGVRMGLNYQSLEFIARMHEIELHNELILLVQTAEHMILRDVHRRLEQKRKADRRRRGR